MSGFNLKAAFLRIAGVPETADLPPAVKLSISVAVVIVLTVVTTIAAFLYNNQTQQRLSSLRIESRDVRIVQLALLDVETGARGFVLTARPEYLQPYSVGLQVLDNNQPTLDLLDRFVADEAGAAPGTHAFSALVAHFRSQIGKMIEPVQVGGSNAADQRMYLDGNKAAMDTLRQYIGQFLAAKAVQVNKAEDSLAMLQTLLLVLQIVSGIAIMLALYLAFRALASQARSRAAAMSAAVQSREQVEHLLAMADMLQSAMGYEDANAVLRATAKRLLSGLGGALYIFNNSRDRLDLSTAWGADEVDPTLPQVISPSQCWALKRGKPHINQEGYAALKCDHALEGRSALEIPMLARGEIHGLLQIFSNDSSGTRLEALKPLAVALADNMSLALSSIALRERLRNQALRDPLTGLYNRRFMEEVLESFAVQAERRNSPMSAIMVDLDHFKKLNDEHGHAVGDTVLRDVAGVILATIRKSDIACRYGGEELIILMPDSDLPEARTKAEEIRKRIAELSPSADVAVSASLGVASIPQTSADPTELLTMADAALYRAKHEGRNRVEAAPLRMAAARR